MGKPHLVCRRNAATGLPRLESHGIRLRDQEHHQLEQEIMPLFEWLVLRGDGDTIMFETHLQSLPQPTEFRVRKSGRGRCPDLKFEPTCTATVADAPVSNAAVQKTPPADFRASVFGEMAEGQDLQRTVATSSQDWQGQFLTAAEQFVSPAQRNRLPSADRVAIEYVLAELARLGREQSVNMTPVLLAGYFSLGHEMCLQFDPDRTGLYQLASRALDQLYAQTAGVAHERSPVELPVRRDGRRLTGLCNLLRGWLGEINP